VTKREAIETLNRIGDEAAVYAAGARLRMELVIEQLEAIKETTDADWRDIDSEKLREVFDDYVSMKW